jgi:hypothetical protein
MPIDLFSSLHYSAVNGGNMVKYQVFISSTYEDLRDERDQVIKAILEMGHIPVGMEMFSAGDKSQWTLIKKQLEDVDYYIVIIAHRYGSIDDNEGISYTEKEYDYAISLNIPVIGLIIDDSAAWPKKKMDTDPIIIGKLNEFKSKVKNKMVSFWKTKEDLNGKAAIAFGKEMNRSPRIGWVKANTVTSPEFVKELTRLSSENSTLRQELSKVKNSKDKENEKIEEAINILISTKTDVHVWRNGGKEWGKPEKMELLNIFKALVPIIQVELDFDQLNSALAFEMFGKDLRISAPLPNNRLRDWLADLAALNLINPSTIRHPITDSKQYWSITTFGNKVYSRIRFYLLKSGKTEKNMEAPE